MKIDPILLIAGLAVALLPGCNGGDTTVANPSGGSGSTATTPVTYVGSVHLLRSDLDAVATLNWSLYDSQIDYGGYLGSGTLDGTLTVPGCTPATFSLAISSGDALNPDSLLTAFNGQATAPYTLSHNFTLKVDPTAVINLTCGGVATPYPASGLLFMVGTAACSTGGSGLVHHTDAARLTGTWSCLGRDLTATWDFTAQ
ncbi:MAG: hypothetical protein COX57_01890 [Alphaproteobacteria bacterium CG_4_10_14_0_2_um_filter_63_37]|nr:MAG: hypothetical protein AUJ55_10875 [Proteobacteria bacterium CG1_02_64_396]PJA25759.1 MAG: hypothetical protein COX57_01890 [Alphaproteobacteria bacterium CG_4_10_14_0_2_um_filter_63_37]